MRQTKTGTAHVGWSLSTERRQPILASDQRRRLCLRGKRYLSPESLLSNVLFQRVERDISPAVRPQASKTRNHESLETILPVWLEIWRQRGPRCWITRPSPHKGPTASGTMGFTHVAWLPGRSASARLAASLSEAWFAGG